jgi:purine-nucleoside phosphorylase
MTSLIDKNVTEAVAWIAPHLHDSPKLGIVAGSGLGGVVDKFQHTVRIRYEDIPHFPVSSVKGHQGEAVAGNLGGKNLFALSGRVHYYEGYPIEKVVFPIQVMAGLGVTAVIITNAAGAINKAFTPGDIVTIKGHMDLMRARCWPPSGNSATTKKIYDTPLMELARKTAGKLGLALQSGVYAALSGPSYETPAEIRALRIMGADMVGMSTVPEATMAGKLGMKVLGLSFITNLAAGMSQDALSHQEVIETSERILPTFQALIQGIVSDLDLTGEQP